MVEQTTTGAISPSTGRTLPDRYIEGTCPICGYDGARGDQCDNCGNQLDPADLIEPAQPDQRRDPGLHRDRALLPRPAGVRRGARLRGCRQATDWRPNVLKFSLNLLDDLQPRAMTRDIDWGIPVPLAGWRGRTRQADLRLVRRGHRLPVGVHRVGPARRGDPDAWRGLVERPRAARSYYFMGKDNITFHSQIWPAELLGYAGAARAAGRRALYGKLNLPTEVVSQRVT